MKLIPLPSRNKHVFKFSNYLFNEPILTENPNYVFICEGQSDTYTLMELGVNVVGLSGNSNLYKHAYKFSHIPNIAILLDSDEPSQKRLPGETLQLLYKLKALKSSSKVYIVDLPKLEGVKDVNDIKVKFGLTKKEVSKFKRTPAIEYLISIYAKDLDSHINLLPLLDDTNLLKFSELSGISIEALQYARRIVSPV
jgi:DNA primase